MFEVWDHQEQPDEEELYGYVEEEPWRPGDWAVDPPFDFSLLIGLAALIFLMIVLTRTGPSTTLGDRPAAPLASMAAPPFAMAEAAPLADPYAFAAPYAEYVITQGIHGASYGQMAVDLAAGQGAEILSPIHGIVSDKYVDQYGNTTLILENEVYIVKMLHGIYTLEPGDEVRIGDPVGTESNLGYTTDMRGVPCAGRTVPCGYHTHMNVYNQELGANVNPLDLIGR